MRVPTRNQGAAGPLRYRLSEPPASPERPGEAAPPSGPGPDDAAAERTAPDPRLSLRAAALLGNLPRPTELSPAAMVRIRERLGTLGAQSVPRPWWQWAAASTAALGAATVAALLLPRPAGPRPSTDLVVRELRLPDSGVARLRSGPGSDLLLSGPGALALPVGEAPARLSAGRLAVRAGREDVVIDAAGRRVTVPKGHMAEVVVHLGELVRVAAYVGDSSLLTRGQPLSVRQGTVWTRDGERPLAVECRGLVTAALDGGPWPSSRACGEATITAVSPAAGAPVAVAITPAEPEPIAAPPAAALHPVQPAARPVSRVVKVPALVMAAAPATGAKGALVGPPSDPAAGHGSSGLADESRLLGVVLHQLHQERDGSAALRSLDSYQQRFPKGLLGEEAQAARVDALLLLDHRSEALALLEQTQFQRLGRGGELRVVRGELRATAGRCREALADFAAVLASTASPAPPPVTERALYGQASCLAQLADTPRARATLELYLTRFPTGRFAEAARRSLQTLQ